MTLPDIDTQLANFHCYRGVRYSTAEEMAAAKSAHLADLRIIWRRSAIVDASEVSQQSGISIREVLETQYAAGDITYTGFTVKEIQDALSYRAELEAALADDSDAPVNQR